MDPKIREMAQGLMVARSVALVCHVAPDGDTLGAACALALALERLGKGTALYCADPVPKRLAFLPGAERFTRSVEEAAACDVVMAVDCAAPDRMGPGKRLLEGEKPTLVLDHHGSNIGFGRLYYVAEAPSTCEMVFPLLEALGVAPDAAMADCLYVGMVTDTGRFAFPGVTGDTLRRAAQTLDAGAHYDRICREQFQTRSLAATRLLGIALQSLELSREGRLAMMAVTAEDMAAVDGRLEDMESIVNYASEVEGVDIGVMLYPASGQWKVSLRAGERARVDTVAALLQGGGHPKAAGGRAGGTLAEAKAQVRAAVEKAGALR